jgi:hypothetical protein
MISSYSVNCFFEKERFENSIYFRVHHHIFYEDCQAIFPFSLLDPSLVSQMILMFNTGCAVMVTLMHYFCEQSYMSRNYSML